MADVKISGLPASTTPLAGTEVLPIVQSGSTKQVSVANLTAGRSVAALSVVTPTIQAEAGSAGGTIKNGSGVTQMQWGAGGASNLSLEVATNINPANAAVNISPTGTGTVAIAPATLSSMNNVAIGVSTPAAGAFTTLAASSTVSGAGFSTYLASPPAIGGTTPAAGSFTTVKAATTVGVGAATPAASGAGITFPATQSASSDANTLDDYEEGTFYYQISDGTNNAGGPFAGTYTKIGRTVTVSFSLYSTNVTALTATSGQLRITGLPFTSALDQCFASGNIWADTSGLNYFSTCTGTSIFFTKAFNTTDTLNVTMASLGTPTTMSFFGCYTYQAS